MERRFNEVRDFIYDNPNAHIDEVCEKTGVEAADIKRWLAEGRLLLSKGSPISLQCSQCGKAILSGSKCEECLGKLLSTLQAAAETIRPPEPPKPQQKPMSQKTKEKMHVTLKKN